VVALKNGYTVKNAIRGERRIKRPGGKPGEGATKKEKQGSKLPALARGGDSLFLILGKE